MEKDYRRFGALSSSNNPQELAASVQATIKVISGIAVTFGLLTAAENITFMNAVTQATNGIVLMIPIVYSIWNSAEIVFGLLRKIVVKVFDRY